MSVAPRGMSFGAGCALSTAARTSNGDGKRVPHITLYTGTDCSLCDVVKDVLLQAQSEVRRCVAKVCRCKTLMIDPIASYVQADFTIAYYNIRDDSMPDIQKWRRQYQYDIPVCHLDGKGEARSGTVLFLPAGTLLTAMYVRLILRNRQASPRQGPSVATGCQGSLRRVMSSLKSSCTYGFYHPHACHVMPQPQPGVCARVHRMPL